MTDDEIRGLVRLAIQKHLGAPANVATGFSTTVASAKVVSRTDVASPQPPPLSMSFGRYGLPRAEDDTMCIIESAVTCNHCGYCQCHGH